MYHEHRHSGWVLHRQHLEDERTADLVGGVGDESIAGRKLRHLDDISEDDLELLGEGGGLHSLCDFGTHSRVKFDYDTVSPDLGCFSYPLTYRQ